LVAYHRQKFSAHAEAFPKNFYSDDHFDRPFLFMGVKGKPQQQLEQENYENSICNETNLLLAFSACSASHRTSVGYHRCVDRCAGPRNSLVWLFDRVHSFAGMWASADES